MHLFAVYFTSLNNRNTFLCMPWWLFVKLLMVIYARSGYLLQCTHTVSKVLLLQCNCISCGRGRKLATVKTEWFWNIPWCPCDVYDPWLCTYSPGSSCARGPENSHPHPQPCSCPWGKMASGTSRLFYFFFSHILYLQSFFVEVF